MNVSIKIEDVDKVLSATKRAPALMIPGLNRAIRKSIIKVNQVAREDKLTKYVYGRPAPNPRRPRTGKLKSDWDIEYGSLQATTEALKDYAVYLHEGTRYIHPPRPFLAEAVDDLEGQINTYFEEEIDSVFAQIAKEAA